MRRRCGPPVNVQVFTSFLENPAWDASGALHRVMGRIGRWVLRRADTVRVESATERDKVLRLGVATDRVWVIPLAVNAARFAADGRTVRAQLLGEQGEQLVLYVGRLAPEKDLGTLLHHCGRHVAASWMRERPRRLQLLGSNSIRRQRGRPRRPLAQAAWRP